ncbi:MFS transporter [Blautia sp. OF11-22]|uniref:MFS transporter n=1 Tax=Blautia sp. OF11-22 TaxID=2292982 RepID=UPI000E5C7908|nr:MFS transporter [Blautia sp. OF11-22]RHV80175.1 MFS transporter [Blautia sp. OF11-22]
MAARPADRILWSRHDSDLAIALTILFLICVFRFPFKKDRKKAEAEKEETGAAGPVDFLKRYPSFVVVLLGCILIFMSHSLINSFNYQIAMAKGGGSGEMGNAMTISAVSELPTMFLFGYLLKKKSSVFWLRLSGLFFVLKSIGTFLAFNIPTYYAVQPFQMFGWALINVACVYYVDGIMEPQDSIKGQAYMAMTITAGNVMSSLFGGWLIDAAGVGAMLICASLAAFIGWLIVCLGSKEAKTA